MHILHVDCSPRKTSKGRCIPAGVAAQLRALGPEKFVTKRTISTLFPFDHVVIENRTVALGPDGKKDFIADRTLLVDVAADGITLGKEAQQSDFFIPLSQGCPGMYRPSKHTIYSGQATLSDDSGAQTVALEQAPSGVATDLRGKTILKERAAGANYDA
ncbi:hypothetical protein [Asaia prunellae]|uniref:hypothetical protein n=1 Tax=Asaia prunellae TaxID=610245 RepID=UPI00047132C9|nr:hypothetical protein [Asaia prunellae]